MIYAVWIPLLVPFAVVPAACRLADALAPARAVRLLAATGAGLALCTLLALALLVVPGAGRLSVVAAAGDFVHPLTVAAPGAAVPLAVAALVLIAGCAAAVTRVLRRHWSQLHRAAGRGRSGGGELAVLRDSRPDAYALPGRPGRPGRIVVTTGMLHALDPAEREALLAHERAHLAGRHHLYLAAAELSARCHPALRTLRAPLGYALERCADEAAAHAVGDRRVAARAIGRAALAARDSGEPSTDRPAVALAAAAGPVPRRVAALLGRAATRPRAGRAAAAVLLACLALSGAAALDATYDLHSSIEIAQGENP
ncbi:M56 family metallopeptidase [Streptomyces poriferorum]|uniref:M56 family metallopeptidase n=1 Tax=Streptomyces poriferorum TaxID=2798799 RepID=A0ABY9J274_9ACTN|nr:MULTISPECIES: M56 family metallopeptidase [unclassified Streptomyces]MDP5309670.1 M56 family metallopeptidase [Streptomyces sp. Alt4]WLQ61144.1 M56 family metallopeptidase [Streptomyces sp. Alt2]